MVRGSSLGGNQEPGTKNQEPVPRTEYQIREQQRRIELCNAADSLTVRKISLRSAAVLLGEPIANLSRWRTARTAGGDEALIPDVSPGRKIKFALSDTETKTLRGLALQKGSIPVAIEWFAQHADCTPATRELITAELDRAARLRIHPHWPDSLRRAARPTVDEEAAFRGRKHSMEVEFTERRGLEWVDEDGTRRPMLPNTIWESDDMSSNEPFTWTESVPDGQMLRIGRQTLATVDVFACAWLGVSPIGRERDAYRGEDIADHMADCVAAHGLPTLWRLERGPWENTFVDGVLLGHTAESGPDGRRKEIRWGGLDPLVQIVRAWKSRQKGTVESSFDLLQTLLAHESTSIGRFRGEFEAQTKLYLAAVRGDRAAWARFWSMGEFAEAMATAMHRFNHRPKARRAHGKALVVPADLYRDTPGRPLPESEAWRFTCPEKREATVRQGHIECTAKHYPLPFRFRVNGVIEGLYLEHGYPVLIAFHPGHPEAGCHIFNAERGVRNRDGFQFGEKLLIAPLSEDAPQVNLAPEERAFHARRNANATMRADFRAIGGVGLSPMRRSVVRDGWGNSAVRQTGDGHTTLRSGSEMEPNHTEPPAAREGRTPQATDRRASLSPDPDEELARIEALERAALARGDLLSL